MADANVQRVARYYDTAIFEAELVRLTRDAPAEYAITRRWLERLVPDGALVAEIGVGSGLYSECLARKGCSLHLVDISARLLETAADRLRSAGLGQCITAISQESATDLHSLPAGSFDAVLLLGPLYHLCAAEARKQAVGETARILKAGGSLFAAGINRLAYFRELLRDFPNAARERVDFHEQYLRDGNLDPDHAPPIGFAHMTSWAEFRGLFDDAFEEVALLGAESFSTVWQTRLTQLSPEALAAWLDLIERTAQTDEGRGMSDHFLYVGRRATLFQAPVE
jgi:ubiquinone/menaquinone biosynthesis C-methylase UbiE